MIESDFLKSPQVAAILGVSGATLASWRNRGVGPTYVRFGRAVRYAPVDVHAWALTRRVVPRVVPKPDRVLIEPLTILGVEQWVKPL